MGGSGGGKLSMISMHLYSTVINAGDIINILKCKVISISTVGDSWGVGRDLKCRSHQI